MNIIAAITSRSFFFVFASTLIAQSVTSQGRKAIADQTAPSQNVAQDRATTNREELQDFPGQRSAWHQYDRFDFEVAGRPVLVVVPKKAAVGRPWIWHGEFFGHRPAPDVALLGRGFHVVYMSVPDMLGCPEAVACWDSFYQELTSKYGLARKVSLVGLSRGGLYCYNWAAANPDKVACIYGDAPVCDFKSWPGGKGTAKGSPRLGADNEVLRVQKRGRGIGI